jgi:hypothetical protein
MPADNKYDTQLSPAEEARFNLWIRNQYPGRNLDELTSDYDLRGAWREIESGDIEFDERGHLPDKYKKPNHITFSDQSMYHSEQTPGGRWIEYKPDGKDLKGNSTRWDFQPSHHNIKTHGRDALMNYFKQHEPDSRLLLGPQGFSSVKDVSSTSGSGRLKVKSLNKNK